MKRTLSEAKNEGNIEADGRIKATLKEAEYESADLDLSLSHLKIEKGHARNKAV